MPGLIERYRERLPFAPEDPVVSLSEGSTPLVLAPRLSARAGTEVWLKLEGANPTGSFKDRGMTCAVSAAVREGARAVVCASTGKTAAFELVEALDGELDALCIPVGNAGNITAYWRGFREAGVSPRMLGFQAAGAAPLVHGAPVAHPETVASAIRIGNPARWEDAMDAMTGSGGAVRAVADAQILDAYKLLASTEGVFCEPASAASVAGPRGP